MSYFAEETFMKNVLILFCSVSFCSLILLAQTGKPPRAVHAAEKSPIHVPAQDEPTALAKIYGNLGSKTDAYSDENWWVVAGPNSQSGQQHFFGLPFTPKVNAHVSQVQAALQYNGSGANQVNLSIYGDNAGAPGTLLAGPVTVTNLPESGTCCTLVVANFSPVSVIEGTRYWVVADTPASGTGSDFYGTWDWVPKPLYPQAYSTGSGWIGYNSTNAEAAGEVLGTIP
jgi:hypothetical protein